MLPYATSATTTTACRASIKEQREQLDRRLAATEQRLPQQIVMAYRHLLMLGERNGGLNLEHIDLGPARVDARISDRVLEQLRSADRIADRVK